MIRQMIRINTAVLLASAFFLTGPAFAGDKATKEECVAKVKEAARLAKEIGLDATLKKLNDKNGPFVWKDTYVICVGLSRGRMLAHAIKPRLVGKALKGIKDANGKLFVTEYTYLAKTRGEGWVTYMWPKPGEKDPSKKIAYVQRVPGEDVLMLAGIYE